MQGVGLGVGEKGFAGFAGFFTGLFIGTLIDEEPCIQVDHASIAALLSSSDFDFFELLLVQATSWANDKRKTITTLWKIIVFFQLDLEGQVQMSSVIAPLQRNIQDAPIVLFMTEPKKSTNKEV
jgi:hypothetical protein